MPSTMPAAPSIVEDENGNSMAARRSLRARPQKRYVEPSSDEDESDSEPEATGEREVLSSVQEGAAARPKKAKSRSSRDMDRARKLELRKIRNRQSAAASRKRKSDRIDELEAQVARLLEENAALKAQMGHPGAVDAADVVSADAASHPHDAKRAKLMPPSLSAPASAAAALASTASTAAASAPSSAAAMARRRSVPTPPSSYSSADGARSIDLRTNQLPAVYALLIR